ncbi:hypothetical protein Pcinc_021388 [Petrolisthes cinctipes]|uniref:Calcineurin-like phosphoesterase domain-containing protein n=1 Tax=Petrolisthes cinctipes TaxID=88211 RepID=A0AAE1FHB3_PETCI|nr:hypothetical protein Pcinc_021388 [Petrolisthes cinctipes]
MSPPPPPPLLNTQQHSPSSNTRHKRWQIGGGMLMRGLTGRGRRAYLIVATLLFLLSMSLLILKSWATPRLPPILPDVGFTRGFSQHAAYHSRPLFSQKEWDNLIQEETQRGLVWFVQVSDVHLQRGADAKKEINHFQQFVDDTLSYVQPAAVLVTGDLTNSKTFGLKLSELPQEWLIYQRTVRDRVTRANYTLWLDLPGNHDNFDEVQHAHFRAYAVQPDIGATRVVSGGIGRPNITLLPLDASLKPGIRAFNFLGHLTLQHRQQLEKAVKHAAESGDVLLSYGHYPTNSIVSGGEEREVLAGSAAYLCGHLHAGLGLVNTMWTTHPSGMAEIELADWAHRHRYRILAIDGGKVVWLDVAHPTWPIVLLTALSRHQRTSTSLTFVIRLLVFSNEPISSVSLRVDDELGHWTDCQYNSGSLYTATLFLAPSTAPPTQADFIKALQVLVLHTSGSKSLLRVGMPGVGFEHPRPTLIAPLLLSIKLHSLEGVDTCCSLLQP